MHALRPEPHNSLHKGSLDLRSDSIASRQQLFDVCDELRPTRLAVFPSNYVLGVVKSYKCRLTIGQERGHAVNGFKIVSAIVG